MSKMSKSKSNQPKFKGFEKRNKTLLVEYKNLHKSNKFTDKRLGENDQNLTLEDKMFKRFVVERQKTKDKKTKKFNLNDDDNDLNDEQNEKATSELTHFGQSLAQIETFEKADNSDDDRDDPNDKALRKLNAKFVSENFFGGFPSKTKPKLDANGEEVPTTENPVLNAKNRKEWIEEMIVKSKQIKHERKKEKDITLDLTESLDKQWKQMQPLISGMVDKTRKIEEEKQIQKMKDFELALANGQKSTVDVEDFDYLVKSLQFDAKGQPSEKLKTAEQIEKERKELLRLREQELYDRMNREYEQVPNGDKEDRHSKDSKNKNAPATTKTGMKKIPDNHYSIDDMEFDDPDYLQQKNYEENKQKLQVYIGEEEDKRRKEALEEKKKLLAKEVEEEEPNSENDEQSDAEKTDTTDNDHTFELNSFESDKWAAQFDTVREKLMSPSPLIDVAKFEKFLQTLIGKLDPALDENNKQRLCLLTQRLIELYQKVCTRKPLDRSLLNVSTRYIYELTLKYGNKSTRQDPSIYVALFKKILNDLNESHMETKISERKFPPLSVLMTFKLISTVFPTSDFRHQITTPCLLIMTRYFSQSSLHTFSDLFRGSFLCNLCFEFVNKSKRFIPECVQYLNGVLFLTIAKKDVSSIGRFDLATIYESFKRTKLNLIAEKKMDKIQEFNLSQMCSIESDKTSCANKISLIGYNLDLLAAFATTYQHIISFKEVFSLTNTLLEMLPMQLFPDDLKKKVVSIQDFIGEISLKSREHLRYLNKKPVASKMLEPRVQLKTKFDPRHNTKITDKQLDARKYKKEYKSAIKEIRQDTQFLARVQLKEKQEKDQKRSRKVKEIMGSLASQEGEYQKFKRLKS